VACIVMNKLSVCVYYRFNLPVIVTSCAVDVQMTRDTQTMIIGLLIVIFIAATVHQVQHRSILGTSVVINS